MNTMGPNRIIAFEGYNCIASGEITDVIQRVKEVLDSHAHAAFLIFDEVTSENIEVDFRGTVEDVLTRLANEKTKHAPQSESIDADKREPKGPGRPKLGVVAREVTLLPRHWDWLNSQSGGASVALRKLVEKARHENAGQDQLRQGQESSYKFMSVMAGNLPNFEEAARALFAGNQARFTAMIEPWPRDVKHHLLKLATGTFSTHEKA